MNECDVKRLALVLAFQAEIEGMKVANIVREEQGQSVAYNEINFYYIAQELRELACIHNK